MVSIIEAKDLIERIQAESGVPITWRPANRNNPDNADFCEAVDISLGLAISSCDKLGKIVAKRVADKYRIINFHQHDYAPEDISKPLEAYSCCYGICVMNFGNIKSGINILIKARDELEERTKLMYNRLVDVAFE